MEKFNSLWEVLCFRCLLGLHMEMPDKNMEFKGFGGHHSVCELGADSKAEMQINKDASAELFLRILYGL